MASAMISAATPATTPRMEMRVISEITACLRLALRYRTATMNSNFIFVLALTSDQRGMSPQRHRDTKVWQLNEKWTLSISSCQTFVSLCLRGDIHRKLRPKIPNNVAIPASDVE